MPGRDHPYARCCGLLALDLASVVPSRGARGAASALLDRLVNPAQESAAEQGADTATGEWHDGAAVITLRNVFEAVACALEVRRAGRTGGSDATAAEPRFAVHIGEGDDYPRAAASARDITAALRSLAHPGQILLTGKAAELMTPRLRGGTALQDLGEHRLVGVDVPQRVFQLCEAADPAEFPPLLSLTTVPNNLPAQLTSFVGRRRELHEIGSRLSEARLLTLSGIGGCGKTRLALQAAGHLPARFPGGIWWVDLAPISEPAQVAAALARAVGVWQVPDADLRETIIAALRDRAALLILDNCEHLLDVCAETASAVVSACPRAAVLATSREPLALPGEVTLRVPSLSVPAAHDDAESLASASSVELFVDRARAVRPNFKLTPANLDAVVTICRRLDGIPLALELAAARVRVLAPAQIAEGLSDRFRLLSGGARTAMQRQRTIEASIDWSYRLLDADEQRLLARLAVFTGAFSLDAIEDICSGDGIERHRVLDLLTSLVDKSLVQVDEHAHEAHYRLLEMIRGFAGTKLADSDKVRVVRDRHLQYYAGLAAAMERELRTQGMRRLLDRMEAQFDNLPPAMTWAFESGHLGDGLKIALFWVFHGRYVEVAKQLDAALDAIRQDSAQASDRALAAVMLAGCPGDWETALHLGKRAVDIARQDPDRRHLARALSWYGWALYNLDPPEAKHALEEGLAVAREVDDLQALVTVLPRLGLAEATTGTPRDSWTHFDEIWSRLDPERQLMGSAYVQMSRAGAHGLAGNYGQAAEDAAAAASIWRDLGDLGFVAWSLYFFAIAAVRIGRYEDARRGVEEGIAAASDSGERLIETLCIGQLGEIEYATGDIAAANKHLQTTRDGLRRYPQQLGLTSTLLNLARCRLAAGDQDRAIALLDDADEVSTRFAIPSARASGALCRATLLCASDPVRAETLAHESLSVFADIGNAPGMADAVERIAALACAADSFVEASRLLGAVASFRTSTGYRRFPVEEPEYEQTVAAVRRQLGEDQFSEAWQEGAAMSLEEAVAYARRGRGERKRPTAGWASLTPTELQVVILLSDGLSNQEIADRMFISRGTVKVHLSHVYSKLGLSGRAAVAAEATRRGM